MKFLTRKLVQPNDLNVNNTLFGGRILSWVDEEAAIFAALEANHRRMVTKSISAVNFISPAFLGDVVEIGVSLKRVSKTSLTVQVVVRDLTTQRTIVNIDEMVFVAVDEHGVPMKHGLCD
jgi:acyl-CoA hydrolase